MTPDELRRLEEATRGEGVSALLLTSAEDKERILDYVAAGNTAQFADPGWADEMRTWIRFNARDAVRTRDGLFGAVLGIPGLPAWLGKIAMRVAVSAERQNQKDAAHIRSSGAIVVISSDVDDARHWVEAGRSYQRMALEATSLGLRTAFINQPVEVAALRPQLASALGLGSRRPDLIVRVGRGPEMPRSLRRPIDQVIVGSA